MSLNRERPHLMVLPEDDANFQIAQGFRLNTRQNTHQMQILPSAGGWISVKDEFKRDHVGDMRRRPLRHMVLMIDLDGRSDRMNLIKEDIPPDVQERVYVLGVQTEPEQLRRALKVTLEEIGKSLANECSGNSTATWNHALLVHNADEVQRMRQAVRPIFF